MLKQEIQDKITKKSLSLEKFGLNDLAWNKEEAQNLIRAIMEDRIGILGGDVYRLDENHLEPLYDNWSCEQINKESKEEYFKRSKVESLNFIEKYLVKDGDNVLFSITFTEKFI